MNKFNDYFEHILNSYVLSGINNISPLAVAPLPDQSRYAEVPYVNLTVDSNLNTFTYRNKNGDNITVQDISDISTLTNTNNIPYSASLNSLINPSVNASVNSLSISSLSSFNS